MSMTFSTKDYGGWAIAKPDQTFLNRLVLTNTKTGEVVKLYRPAKNGYYYIPRALSPWSDIPIRQEWKVDIPFRFTLRPDQEEVVSTVLERLRSKWGGIIQATTGSGKTIMALKIASELGLRTLVVVPSTTIMDQWIERINEVCGLQAGVIRQDTAEVREISVGMIHSLSQRDDAIYQNLTDKFGLVIFDEVHTVGARTFSRVAPMFSCKWRIGLSATPRRKDGMDNVFLWHIGPVLTSMIRRDVRPTIKLVEYYSLQTGQAGCVYKGELVLGRYLNKLSKDNKRSAMIAKIVEAAIKKNRQILVLSDRLKILSDIYKHLGNEAKPLVGFMTGNKKQPEKQVILATYGCAGQGFDKTELDTLILATPRVDIEQAVGRLLRPKSKNTLVIDFVDTASPIMARWANARVRQYRRLGFEVTK